MGFRSLSRRRKLLAAGVTIAAVAGAITAGVAALAAGSGAGRTAGYPAQDRPGPVLLVPGYGGQTGSLSVLAARIRATGRRRHRGAPARQRDRQLDHRRRACSMRRSSVRCGAGRRRSTWSATRLVAWSPCFGRAKTTGAGKARRVVTLGSPFHGTRLAADAAGFLPGACPAACQQLVPGSPLLAQAGRAPRVPGRLRWLSLWTTDDEVVMPADSARLAGAINVPIQSVCPGHQVEPHRPADRSGRHLPGTAGHRPGPDPPRGPAALRRQRPVAR